MSKPFDLLKAFAAFGREQRIALNDPDALKRFGVHASATLQKALAEPTFLHGHRTQNMFEALLVSLGSFKLLKVEDEGRVYSMGKYRAPDFRVVLDDERTWLIEVKNVYDSNPMKQQRRLMSPTYLRTLQDYAAAMSCPLKIAIYWARWRIWTLISPEKFVDRAGGLTIDMKHAIPENEMATFGDLRLGTTPPLRLSLCTDTTKPRKINENGQVEFTIGEAKIYCSTNEIVKSTERDLAWILMEFGDWDVSEPEAKVVGDVLEAIEFVWSPSERQNEGFELIGTLSTMFSRYYAMSTLSEGSVIQTVTTSASLSLAPLISKDYVGDALPLWRFLQRPVSESKLGYDTINVAETHEK